MIVAGGGVRASGAARELVALAEALQIPVVTSLNGKDSIPGNHPLSCGVVGTYSRESANKVVNAADLVCYVGTTTGGMTTHFWAVPKIGTPAIQIDIDPEALGLNYPLQARVNGDAKVTLTKMLAAADKGSAGKRKAWVEQAQGICKEWYAKYKPMLESDAVPINPARICHELSKHVPDDAIVVVDTGHAGMWMGGMYDLRTTDAELYAQRRPSRLGISGGARRQMRRAGPPGGDVHRRRRLLVSHRRHRDGGALEDQRRDGGQQQRRRQPVEARLRPRLWRHADRAGARVVDVPQDELRPHRRGDGRARHPRRGSEGRCPRRWRRRSPPTAR